MNRFAKRKVSLRFLGKFRISVIVFAALIIVFLWGISSVSRTTSDKQTESLANALRRSIIHCYCVEGTYPPSLEYLTDHYGLIYDDKQFYIDYVAYGSNIMPDVTIIVK
ncbi:MAG: hypothetical protein ACI4F8_11325 [Lachnospiraceae bacterium]